MGNTALGSHLTHHSTLLGLMRRKRSQAHRGIKVSVNRDTRCGCLTEDQLPIIRRLKSVPVSASISPVRPRPAGLIHERDRLTCIASSITVYGAGTDYTVNIDSSLDQQYIEKITGRNETGRNILYSSDQLTYSPHTISIINQGESLLLDLITFEVQLGADG